VGGFVLSGCAPTRWTDRPDIGPTVPRGGTTRTSGAAEPPLGVFPACSDAGGGSGCPFESNVTTKTQEKELRNEAARGLTAGFRGSGVCVDVRTLSHCQHLHRHPSRRRPNHPQRRQRARMLRVSYRVM